MDPLISTTSSINFLATTSKADASKNTYNGNDASLSSIDQYVQLTEKQMQTAITNDGSLYKNKGMGYALAALNLALSHNTNEGATKVLKDLEKNQKISTEIVNAMDKVRHFQNTGEGKDAAQQALKDLKKLDSTLDYTLNKKEQCEAIITGLSGHQNELSSKNNVIMIQVQDLTAKSNTLNNAATNLLNKMTEHLSTIAHVLL